MATPATVRTRSVVHERQAVAAVEREIRSAVRPPRSRYLREFTTAFQNYRTVMGPAQVARHLTQSDVVLIGDYHSLSACQSYTETLLAELAREKRPLVLALEAMFSTDQPALQAWWAEELSDEDLTARVQFEREWGYDWQPYRDLLQAARRHCEAVYGLDCRPRFDLRGVRRRDRHAASVLGRVRAQHPEARLVVLVGESHLAPSHLPARAQRVLPAERVLTVLQNVDALYWQAAGEGRVGVEAVEVRDDVLCVFSATPLEKYESYRHYLERWEQE
jgi:hypothetical protein